MAWAMGGAAAAACSGGMEEDGDGMYYVLFSYNKNETSSQEK